MYPMNRFTDSHPYQRNHQVPYNPHYYPHFELNPHHMNIDPTRSTLPYESWPCSGNYGHLYPAPCHSCCIHNNSPSQCAFRPPYPYLPPPSCSYPAYPVMYPPQYVPPPHFTMEQPRYEYEKTMDRDHHCCGCPNHPCSNKKGGSGVRIEEHDQDKKNESNESFVPFGLKNCPYPVVWLPSEDTKNTKNGEQTKPYGSKRIEQEEDSQVVKPYGDFRPVQQPNVWNVWPPHHGNNSESPKQRGDVPGKQHHGDVNRKQFPFPIFWMPYKPEEAREKVNEESDSGLIAEQEPTSPSKLTKQMLQDSEENRSNSKENEVNSGSEIHGKGANKESVIKTIPVKQVEQNEKVLDGKKEDASQRRDGDAKDKKITEDGGKKQSSSPKKSSKLPPVCLRVDPLPRKKDSNGSSRSPSPPGGKGKLVESRSDSSNLPVLSNEKENVQLEKSSTAGMPEKSIKVEPSKTKTKVVEVAQGKSKEDKLQEQFTVFPDLKHQARSQTVDNDTTKATNEPKDQPDRLAEEAQSSDEAPQRGEVREAANGGDKMKREKRSKLSHDKAATMIQSVYRGFNVRRWEPLKKLKQIAKIKEQMAELKNQIQALESSAENGVNNKQRTIITEAIMGLLLKLNTIQGLHPTAREYRKSVAKELVSLQEKLDLLNCKKQPAESEQILTAKSREDTCATVEENVPFQGGQEVQKLEGKDDLVKGYEGIKSDAKGPSEEQSLCATEMLTNSHDVGNAEVLVEKEEKKDFEEEMENISGGSAVETGDRALESLSESNENANDKLLDESAAVVEKLERDEAEQYLATTIPFSEELIANCDSVVTGCGFEEKGDIVDELEELPRGVLDEETTIQGSAEIRKEEVFQHDKGDLTAHIPEERVSDTESLEHHSLEELGETPVILEQENTDSSHGQEENAEVQERDAAVQIDIPKREEEEARPPLNEGANISDGDDKVGMDSASDGSSVQLQEDTISTNQPTETINKEESQPTETTNKEESETDEVLQEKRQSAVDRDFEIPDSGKTMEQLAEPQLSTATNDKVQEHHVQDKQKVREENVEVQGEKLPARDDSLVFAPGNEGKECNVEVQLKNRAMAAPTSEIATTETELLGVKELGVAENAVEGNSADAAHSFGSTPAELRVMDSKGLKEWKKVDMSPSSPTASQVSCDSDVPSESDRKLMEENEKLREMMEKLIKAGNEQLSAISSLSGRVEDLEKRLSRKKKLKLGRNRLSAAGSACVKPSNDSLRDRAVGLAM